MKVNVKKIELQFITPGKTSRGVLYSKPSWLISLTQNGRTGLGECSVIPGLSPDYSDGFEERILKALHSLSLEEEINPDSFSDLPSLRFAVETALFDLSNSQPGILFPSDFTTGEQGISINGLIWMGDIEEMKSSIREKLENEFRVLKLKVGALDFDDEIALLKSLRSEYKQTDLEIRLDANGAFHPSDALEKLKIISDFHIHSVEQPIKPGNYEEIARICLESPVRIALDEELISITEKPVKKQLLETIKPQFIILKPGLIGGLSSSAEWVDLADEYGIGWWATSALESNVGLNAIAQWVYALKPSMVQGLGTGQVFSNNIASPLELRGPVLYYDPANSWGIETEMV